MNSNGILRKHWFHVSLHFAADAFLFCAAFVAAFVIRFGSEADEAFWAYWPFLLFSAAAFSSSVYIAGLYSTHSAGKGHFHRSLVLAGLMVLPVLTLIGVTYGFIIHPLGRGVTVLGGGLAYVLAVTHHFSLLHALRTTRERVAYLVTSGFDEVETRLFSSFGGRSLELVGILTGCGYQPTGECRVLGALEDVAEIARSHRIDRVLCTSKNLNNTTLTRRFCELRYSGVSVLPLISLCEEVEQYVPLELVTHEWLLNASGEPHLFYIKKVKRLFDIIASSVGLVLGAPLVALGALAIKLTSPGPVFYFQTRSGRFGRVFSMTKLRTMRVDAEKNGVQWCGKDDPRIHPVGRFLRKYRIDEIPQLWHVLCGDMSFVGPRPERPEIITQLAKEIPFYEERQMVQPGITGWAQVSYPYGASNLDSRRKLEYDLYYMKHMSVFLDIFILLDTVRIVLCGGAQVSGSRREPHQETLLEWARLSSSNAVAQPALELGAA